MSGPLNEPERDAFLVEPHVAVLGILRGDRPPTNDQALAIVCRYPPEERVQDFVRAEFDHPAGERGLDRPRLDR